jgi:hypothetical protein
MQGQTVVASAGDDGSEGCPGSDALAVDDPASQPLVTGVGGTQVVLAGPPATEEVWDSTGVAAGGGGISALQQMPAYQAQAPSWLGVVGSRSSGTPCDAPAGSECREVPDVSADAAPQSGYLVYYEGNWETVGGTSGAAPLWAALVALADGSAACASGPVGFADPALYDAAATPAAYADDFADVTFGDDDRTGSNGGDYPATAGYDLATGLGTPHATDLASALCAGGAADDGAVSVGEGAAQVGRVGTAATLQLTGSGASGGALTWTAVGLPPGLSIGSSGEVSGSPSSAGEYAVTATASGSGGAAASVSFLWTIVAAGADIVTVADPGPQTSRLGAEVDVPLSAADSGASPITWTSRGLPTYLRVDAAGDVVGEVTAEGTFLGVVTATDATGAADSVAFLWTVLPPEQTSTTFTISGAAAYGDEEAVHFAITAGSPAGAPSGDAVVRAGTLTLCAVTLAGGAGRCSPAPGALAAGSHQVVVTYEGGDGYSPSSSAVRTLSVAKAATTVTLTLSLARLTYGDEQAERVSVVVSPRYAGLPGGTVTIRAGGVALCSAPLAGGRGSCAPEAKALRSGTWSVVAAYGGSADFLVSSSAARILVVTS